MQLPRWIWAIIIVLITLWMGHVEILAAVVDYLWFESLGYTDLFLISFKAQLGLWMVGFVTAGICIWTNLWFATRRGGLDHARLSMLLAEFQMEPQRLKKIVRLVAAAAVVLPSLVFGQVASDHWLEVLTFVHRVDFGVTEPVFNQDVGFYFFILPMAHLLQGPAVGLVVMSLLPVLAFYFLRDVVIGQATAMSPGARNHVMFVVAALFLCLSAGWWLDRFELLFGSNGVVHGVGYTDEHARLPGYAAMAVVGIATAAALLFSIVRGTSKVGLVAVGLYFLLRFLLGNLWPGIVQDYHVKPNELELETPYLVRNIEGTRTAYGLGEIEVRPFDASSELTMEGIRDNPLTVNNVRVWDTRPLLSTYGQLQEIRLYYDFHDVDVDRYMIDGQLRQVMLSARELNYRNIPSQAQSWVNEHFQYTHGYGMTMSPVNVVTEEGLPELFIKDIPPVAPTGLEVDRPEIYYGELTDSYVFVKTGTEEFDYPMGEENAYVTYAGDGGVGIGSTFKKFLFSLYFSDLDILLSQYLKEESRVMFRRELGDRLSRLVPFLKTDPDPYLVLVEGRLLWMVDAYTVSDRYPYSENVNENKRRGFNYIRNSVKIVVDAYDGRVSFYVSDPEDPLIQAYGSVFPGVFQPMEAMPEALHSHVRYPVGMFDVQANMFRAYHMTDPTVFYNKEDMWENPRELYSGMEQPMQSYYLIMKLPGSDEAEFILLLPFVPTSKDNMISWLAARCDPKTYGKLVLYQFPKQKLIYGPRQIEARIDQDPAISELITLWSQAGSRVVRGNLLVIPIEDSLVYVEPLYLQAESSQMPELKRVIVSYDNQIAMKPTLDEALAEVFKGAEVADVASAPSVIVTDQASSSAMMGWQSLAATAHDWLISAENAQKEGDWAGYGEALDALSNTLQVLQMEAQKGSDTEAEAASVEPTENGDVPAGE